MLFIPKHRGVLPVRTNVPLCFVPCSNDARSGARCAIHSKVESCRNATEDPTRHAWGPRALGYPLERSGHQEPTRDLRDTKARTFWLSVLTQAAPAMDLKSAIERSSTTRLVMLVSL